ncbi:hypothetical protein Cantr_05951 [Candida viswanathii]|uniref:Uncharacterized protein n=1 Tax=Candida viswanathii TaxID=5486 RepID=A0A367XSF6_9ASCO|nr:hypothetical protein Cantr_05951 [Candida viswanathii]
MLEINLNSKPTTAKTQPFPHPPPPVYHRAQSTTSINTIHGNSSTSTINSVTGTPKRPGDYYTAKLMKRRSDASATSTALIHHDNSSLFSVPSSVRSSTTTILLQMSSPKPQFQRSFSVPALTNNQNQNHTQSHGQVQAHGKPMLSRTTTKTRFITTAESKQREKLRKQTFDEEVDDDEISCDESSLILFNVPLHNDLITKNL